MADTGLSISPCCTWPTNVDKHPSGIFKPLQQHSKAKKAANNKCLRDAEAARAQATNDGIQCLVMMEIEAEIKPQPRSKYLAETINQGLENSECQQVKHCRAPPVLTNTPGSNADIFAEMVVDAEEKIATLKGNKAGSAKDVLKLIQPAESDEEIEGPLMQCITPCVTSSSVKCKVVELKVISDSKPDDEPNSDNAMMGVEHVDLTPKDLDRVAKGYHATSS
ncbi:hypothetical protein PAXRUDRAFT_29093, partial [Paxillus rubicundulus Ve08.2h10]